MKNNHCVHALMMAGAALVLLSAPSMAMDNDEGPGPGMEPPMGEERGPGMMGEGPGPKHEKGFWKEEEASLGLSEEQRAQMKAVREGSMAAMKVLRSELKAKHEAVRQALDADVPDRAKAEAIVKEISVLEEKMGLGRVDTVLKIRSILTPEQFQKLQAFREKKKAERQERRGKMKHRKGKAE